MKILNIKTNNRLSWFPEGRFARLVGLSLGLSLLAAPAVSGQCLYEATIIQGPMCTNGSPATFGPSDLDEQGNAAGGSSCFLASHATVWTGSGLAIPLPDSNESRTLALTDPDHVVGTDFQAAQGFDVAAYWEFGVLQILGALPGQLTSKAHGINLSQQIVGISSNSTTGDNGTFLWENGDFFVLSGFPIGATAIANDINDDSQIVGEMGVSLITSNAFLWENGIVTDLGKIPGGTSANAVAISSIGHVVGAGRVPREGTIFGVPHAFFWDGQTMIDLGVLPGKVESIALDLNDADQIVGSSFLSGEGNSAVLWQDGQIYDLNELNVTDLGGVVLRRAVAINNAGQILVSVNGAGILLTPIGSAPGDIDNNCFVNVSDLLLLLGEWGNTGSIADINEDGNVNVTDLLALLGSWG